MSTDYSQTNPMDHIEVRPLRFDYNKIELQDPVWSRSHPLFSIYINALGIHVPYFERYLVKSFRKVREDVASEKLKKEVTAIIGQEAHHGRNFIEFNQFLTKRYPIVAELDTAAKQYFESRLQSDSRKQQIGFIAGYETFTFLGGMIILDGYQRWMQDADPVTRSLWLWHQVEEVEHGAVAFDVYQHFYGEYEWYRKWMVLKALLHLALETWRAYLPMCRKEGYFSNPFKAIKSIGFYIKFSFLLAKNALPVFSKNYHPKSHALKKLKQNELAIAWRKEYQQGHQVGALTSKAISNMWS